MDSMGIIYYTAAPCVERDPELIELFRNSVQTKDLDLPLIEGEMEVATLKGKYLITRAGKMIWISLIINQKPTLFTREGLNWFSILFEKHYEHEIENLYTQFQGDISIFSTDVEHRRNIYDLLDEVFHYSLTLPYKLSSSKTKGMSQITKEIWQIAKQISHKSKEQFFLKNLLEESKISLTYDENEIMDSIFYLVMGNYVTPIHFQKSEELKH